MLFLIRLNLVFNPTCVDVWFQTVVSSSLLFFPLDRCYSDVFTTCWKHTHPLHQLELHWPRGVSAGLPIPHRYHTLYQLTPGLSAVPGYVLLYLYVSRVQ